MRRCQVLLVVLFGLLAACSSGEEPSASGTVASTPGPSAAVDDTASPPGPPADGTAAPSPAAAPSDLAGAAVGPGQVLVASDRGVDLVSPDGQTRALTSLPARAAYDDGAGGVVLQGLEPPGPDPPSAAVMWLPPGGGEAITVVGDGAADAVRLWDAGVVDGAPAGLLTVRDRASTLRWVTLPDGETEGVDGVAAPTEASDAAAPSLVTYGGEHIAVQWDVPDGSTVVVAAPTGTYAFACRPADECPAATAIAADGSRRVSVVPVEDGHQVVVSRLDADDPEQVVAVPSAVMGEARPDDVRMSGDLVVVNRVTGTGEGAEVLEAVRVDLPSGEVALLPLAGRAAPTR